MTPRPPAGLSEIFPTSKGAALLLFPIILATSLFALAAEPSAKSGDDEPLPAAKPIPALRIVPQAGQQFAVRWGDREISRYHAGATLRRPFLFPIVGPAGELLTRIGHPHDADSHSHHNSVWISHHDVAGIDFWSDRGGQIVHRRFDGDGLLDGDDAAGLRTINAWVGPDGKALLDERRQMWFFPRPERQWLLVIEFELSAANGAVTLGKTPFGPVAVRMAKSIGVHDGGGLIRNSAGGRNEAGVFWKSAHWVDYSGPVTPAANEGITLMDHPDNVRHPPPFHVRDDGWMGVALTQAEPLTIEPDKPLRLRYGMWVHAGVPSIAKLNAAFDDFAKLKLPARPVKKP